MSDEEERPGGDQLPTTYLKWIASDMKITRQLMTKVCNYMVEAESEIPEKMRRFIMYMHDVHDVMWMYTEQGHEPPDYIKQEAMRCDDRYRQLLAVMHTDGGAFEKVRREMSADMLNKWDHTKQIAKSSLLKEKTDDQARTTGPEGSGEPTDVQRGNVQRR